jgi:hypothetical protein
MMTKKDFSESITSYSNYLNAQKVGRYDNLGVIDTSGWDYFEVSTLFDVHAAKKTSLYDLENIYGIGEYPYITTTSRNNGVSGHYNHWTEKGGVLCIESACTGYASYQFVNFSASEHIEVLTPKFKMDTFIGLFLCTVFRKQCSHYNYHYKFNKSRIRQTELLLPAKLENEITVPDFNRMSEFIGDFAETRELINVEFELY